MIPRAPSRAIGKAARDPVSFTAVVRRKGPRAQILLAVAGGAAVLVAAWVLAAPDPPLRIPPLHPPHAVRAAQPTARAPGAPEDDPIVDDAPPPPSATGNPDEPTRRDLEAGMEKTKKHVARCQSLEQFSGTLMVRVVIARSGNVQSVTVQPPLDKTLTGQCVQKAVKNAAEFPRFKGEQTPSVELTYPFFFRGDGVM